MPASERARLRTSLRTRRFRRKRLGAEQGTRWHALCRHEFHPALPRPRYRRRPRTLQGRQAMLGRNHLVAMDTALAPDHERPSQRGKSARRRFCGRAASQARCWAGSVRRPTTDRPTCCAALGSAKGLRAASLVGLHSLDELPPAVHAIARHRGTDLATAILEVHHSARRLHSCIVRNGIKI